VRSAGLWRADYAVVFPIPQRGLLGIIDNLESGIRKLSWELAGTEWGDYYEDTNYEDESFNKKLALVKDAVERCKPQTVWDLGANTGTFSRTASDQGIFTVAFDIDYATVEKNYRTVKAKNETAMLPLILDLTNPSPGLGWDYAERLRIGRRGQPDLVFALALIHHLAISNNVPLPRCADFFAGFSKRLLSTREDIFPVYMLEGFTSAFQRRFNILEENPVPGSERKLLLLERKPSEKGTV
jgi:hypothetical protein